MKIKLGIVRYAMTAAIVDRAVEQALARLRNTYNADEVSSIFRDDKVLRGYIEDNLQESIRLLTGHRVHASIREKGYYHGDVLSRFGLFKIVIDLMDSYDVTTNKTYMFRTSWFDETYPEFERCPSAGSGLITLMDDGSYTTSPQRIDITTDGHGREHPNYFGINWSVEIFRDGTVRINLLEDSDPNVDWSSVDVMYNPQYFVDYITNHARNAADEGVATDQPGGDRQGILASPKHLVIENLVHDIDSVTSDRGAILEYSPLLMLLDSNYSRVIQVLSGYVEFGKKWAKLAKSADLDTLKTGIRAELESCMSTAAAVPVDEDTVKSFLNWIHTNEHTEISLADGYTIIPKHSGGKSDPKNNRKDQRNRFVDKPMRKHGVNFNPMSNPQLRVICDTPEVRVKLPWELDIKTRGINTVVTFTDRCNHAMESGFVPMKLTMETILDRKGEVVETPIKLQLLNHKQVPQISDTW